jgi:hypothetical protein
LRWTYRYWSIGREVISDGRLPLRRLDLRLRAFRASSLPRVFDGIEPMSPTPGSRTEITRVPFGLQMMPTQEEQTGVAGSQIRLRRWGMALAKSRRACLSEFKSEKTRGRRLKMTKTKGRTEKGQDFIIVLRPESMKGIG